MKKYSDKQSRSHVNFDKDGKLLVYFKHTGGYHETQKPSHMIIEELNTALKGKMKEQAAAEKNIVKLADAILKYCETEQPFSYLAETVAPLAHKMKKKYSKKK